MSIRNQIIIRSAAGVALSLFIHAITGSEWTAAIAGGLFIYLMNRGPVFAWLSMHHRRARNKRNNPMKKLLTLALLALTLNACAGIKRAACIHCAINAVDTLDTEFIQTRDK